VPEHESGSRTPEQRRSGYPEPSGSARNPLYAAGNALVIYDAVICGAGPAGSFCAYHLAKAGRSVLLFEKLALPRPKVCGGALSRKTAKLVDFDLSPIIHNSVVRATLSYRDEFSAAITLKEAGAFTTVRAQFDAFLASNAVSAGAILRDSTAFLDAQDQGLVVEVKTTGGVFRTRWLIAADGVASTVRKRMFGRRVGRYVPSVEALLRVPDDVMAHFRDHATFDLGGMRRGYGWIFPKRDHLNVGIYSPWGGERMREQLDAFLATHALLRNREVVCRMGSAIPLFDQRSPVALGRTLAIGDAGGFAEGVYGEGIYYAMRTGQMAAEAIIGAGDDHAGRYYGERIARELSPELNLSTWLGRAYFAFPRFAFRHLAMDPRGQDRFTGIITGDATYRDCVVGALRRAPRWLFGISPS